MRIGGWKTRPLFDRYNIQRWRYMVETTRALEADQRAQTEKRRCPTSVTIQSRCP